MLSLRPWKPFPQAVANLRGVELVHQLDYVACPRHSLAVQTAAIRQDVARERVGPCSCRGLGEVVMRELLPGSYRDETLPVRTPELPPALEVWPPVADRDSVAFAPAVVPFSSANGRGSLDNLRLLYQGVRAPRPTRLWSDAIVPAVG